MRELGFRFFLIIEKERERKRGKRNREVNLKSKKTRIK